ncbi:LytTR family DNA-binding domain-containing protein [uncultured Chitinophaga sp.]|jgi:Response regulator of the LytR/AlgR family|uniref:LytR/AlgR family response regulator transcription factor n=1 Tax=uncultured Chitinophaga sp. TaxID=339340 RepID=UPI0026322118|nr:LytTR family DNA-binding domain-containing protein [uncultured Chitinophaga sp.]
MMLAVSPKYQDRWLKITGSLFCAHFIEAIGREESFFQLLPRKSYQLALLSGFVIAYLLWELISRISAWLDVHYDWFVKPLARVFLQAIFGVILTAILLYVLTLLQMRIFFNQDIEQVSYLLYEFPVSCVLIVLINMSYFTWYLYHRATPAPVQAFVEAPSPAPAPKPAVILVNRGARNLPLPVEQVAYAYKNGDYTYLQSFGGDHFLVSYSLDDLEAMLDESHFFRANRQLIVQRKAVHSFSPREFGKLSLQLEPAFREPVIVSQKKAPVFKSWLLNGQ